MNYDSIITRGIDRHNPRRHCNIYIYIYTFISARTSTLDAYSQQTDAYTAKQCMHIHTVR